MNTYAKVAIAAAAVLVVGVIGYQLLPAQPGFGGNPSPSPSLAPTLAPTASAAAIPALPRDGYVEAGKYVLVDLDFSVDVPAGWGTCCDGVITKSDFAGLIYASLTDITVYADSCHSTTGGQSEPRGATAIAAALAAQLPRDATAPESVTVAGLPAVHVRLTVPTDQAIDENDDFVGCEDGKFRTWGTSSDPDGRYQQGPGQIDDMYLLDLDGETVIFDVISGPDIPASDKADLDAMLESLRALGGAAS
jgi:hypothetical protein